MISSLAINEFRGIKSCKIDGLTKINIFIGRNNSGKSSILEALYLTSAAFNFMDPLDRGSKVEYLLNRRCNRGLSWGKGIETLWYGYDKAHPIEIKMKSRRKRWKIKLFDWHRYPLMEIPITPRVAEIYKKFSIETPYQWNLLDLIESKIARPRFMQSMEIGKEEMSRLLDRITPRNLELFMGKMMFIDTNLIHEMVRVEKNLWNDLLKKRLDKLVTNVLRKGYGVDVEDLTYVPYGDIYQLAVKLPTTTIRADDLGDGARYSMVLIMVAALAKGTAILIEEPESHQHPGGLAKSMEMLLDLIKNNNVQLFASTHSIEFARLIEMIAKEKNIDLTTFFIEMDKNGNVEARKITPKDADALRKMGFDTRFLDII